jgi:hypothetical protein
MPNETETGSQCEIDSDLKRPKKPLCCNLPTRGKSGYKILKSSGSRKHAVHQARSNPDLPVAIRGQVSKVTSSIQRLDSTRRAIVSSFIVKDLPLGLANT